MAVIRWGDPFRELTLLQDRMNRVFDETMSRAHKDEEIFTGTWAPPVDILETKDKLVLKAELPGFKEDQIHIRFEGGVLTIEGERKLEKQSGDESYHRVERSYGRFVRSFSIPASVEHDKITAGFESGILTIALPKREETKPKQIRISVSGPAPSPIDVAKS